MVGLDDFSFTILDNVGKEVKCDIISLITDNETNQTYVVYTDYMLTPLNKFRILVSEIVCDKGEYILKDLEDEEKLEEIKKTSLTLHSKAYEKLLEKYKK